MKSKWKRTGILGHAGLENLFIETLQLKNSSIDVTMFTQGREHIHI